MSFEELIFAAVERLEAKLSLLERHHAAQAARDDALYRTLIFSALAGGGLVQLAGLGVLWYLRVLR